MAIIDEIRAIKERISLETCNMNSNELSAYYKKGAAEIQKRIDEIRKKREAENRQVANVGS